MKHKNLVLTAFLSAVLSFGPATVAGLQESQVVALKKSLDVPILELAPTAVQVIQTAEPKNQEDVAVAVVRILGSKRPSVLTALVAAIGNAVPGVIAPVAATAAEIAPHLAVEIAEIAARAVPDRAHQIAAAVAKAHPQYTMQITRHVAAAAPIETPNILREVIVAVPASQSLIENDRTLNVVSIWAESRTSASAGVEKFSRIGSRQNPNPPTTPPAPVQQIQQENRSAEVVAALVEFKAIDNTRASLQLSANEAASATITTINTLNAISRDTTLTKQERNSIIGQTVTSVATVLKDLDVSAAQRVQVTVAVAQTTTTIVADQTTNAEVKKSLVTFIQDTAKQTVAQVAQTGGVSAQNVGNTIASIASEVTRTLEVVRNLAPAQAQAELTKVQEKATEIKKAYGAP